MHFDLRRVWGVLTFALLLAMTGPLSAEPAPPAKYQANWESLDSRPMPAWYGDAKFGIFIHWGVYSVPAFSAPDSYSEWYWHPLTADQSERSERNKRNQAATRAFHNRVYGKDFEYKQFAPMFRAELFDPAQWADVFKRSGAKYVVLTSKHHDGFCLFPNEQANKTWGRPWNSVDIGPKRDLLGELGDAVRQAGLKMGFYYSLYEWFNPLWLSDRERFVDEHMIPQFKDVVTRYKPSIIFSDGEWDMEHEKWKSTELLAWLYNESPSRDEIVINDRWGKGVRHKHGGYYTTEYGAGMKDASHAWEESRGMGMSYGYNRNEPLSNYKSVKELVWVLADLVSRGGNFLLDVGPTADGRIPEIMQDRLIEMGKWLDVNGEAIFGTKTWKRQAQWTAGEQPSFEYREYREKYDILELAGMESRNGKARKQVFFTKKPGALYAITPGWPEQELVLLDVRPAANTVVTMLGVEGSLGWKATGGNLIVQMPSLGPDDLPSRYAHVFKITGVE